MKIVTFTPLCMPLMMLSHGFSPISGVDAKMSTAPCTSIGSTLDSSVFFLKNFDSSMIPQWHPLPRPVCRAARETPHSSVVAKKKKQKTGKKKKRKKRDKKKVPPQRTTNGGGKNTAFFIFSGEMEEINADGKLSLDQKRAAVPRHVGSGRMCASRATRR